MKIAALIGLSALLVVPVSAYAQTPAPPYDAQVKADNVNTRSGPGDYWYVTGKLKKGDSVKVLGHQFGWAEIAPPAGHTSLVRLGDIDARGNVGTVRGDRPVAVRACAFGEKRVNRIQLYLTPGQQVTIIQTLGQSYYQIVPPKDATVFVDARMLGEAGAKVVDDKPVGPGPTATKPDTGPLPDNITVLPRATRPDNVDVITPAVTDLRARILEDTKLINAELTKPLLERDYAKLLKRFQDLKADNQKYPVRGVKAYCDPMIEYLQNQIHLQETAAAMATTRPDIDAIVAEAQRIAGAPVGQPIGQLHQVTGVLRTSEALGKSVALPNLHKLESADGVKVFCYVLPPENADWANMLGKNVTVAGKKQYKPEWNFNIVMAETIAAAGEREPGPQLPTTSPEPPIYDPAIFPVPMIEKTEPTTAPETTVEPRRPEPAPPAVELPLVPQPELKPVPPPATQSGT